MLRRLEQASALNALYVLSAQSFIGLFDLELHFFAVAKTFVPAETIHIVAMDENILASVAGLDKSETLLAAKPLYSSALHSCVVLCCPLLVLYQPEEYFAFPIRYHCVSDVLNSSFEFG